MEDFDEHVEDVADKMSEQLKKHHIYGAAYLVHMLTDKRIDAWHVPAMGYAADDNHYLHANPTKYTIVNQTEWLFQHSGMKIPSDDLMTAIIEKYIVNEQTGMKKFGRYF